MVGLLSLAVGTEIIRLGTFQTLRKNTRRKIFLRLIMLALPAPDHRHGGDGGHCFYIASNIFTSFFVFTVTAE
jgi:hypothetical protein